MSSVRRKLALAGILGSLLWGQALPAQADGEFYVVARGENLYRIALKHGTTVTRLMELNGLEDASFVFAGQRLRVAPPETPAPTAIRNAAPTASPPAPASERAPAGPSGPATSITHLVQPGENLYRISLQHDVPYARIMEANGLGSPDFVWAGQQLVIPAVAASLAEKPAPAAAPQAVAPAPSPPAPSSSVQRPVAPAPAAEVKPASDALVHIVEAGQNLYRIALKYGVSWPLLQQANGLSTPDRVLAGQRLVIPTAGGSVSAAPLSSVIAAPPPPPPPAPAVATQPAGLFRITFYCLVGPMSSGRWVYRGAAAADQSIFRLGTVVSVQDLGVYTIEDRFAWDAREQRLDIWVPSCVEAIRLGVMHKLISVRSS